MIKNTFLIADILNLNDEEEEESPGKSEWTSLEDHVSDKKLKVQRRQRYTFSAVQVHILELVFVQNRYISQEKRAHLALYLGISEQQVKIWFQNRRYKSKLRGDSLAQLKETLPAQSINQGVSTEQSFPYGMHYYPSYYAWNHITLKTPTNK